MVVSVQQEFKVQLILYLSRIVHNKDPMSLIAFDQEPGFENRIDELSIGELQELAAYLPDHAITIQINTSSFNRSIHQQRCSAHERHQVQRLLEAGASFPVMNALFGMTSKDVSRLRQRFQIRQVNGRPSVLTDAQQITVKQLWYETLDQLSPAEKLLEIHARTLLPINMLWDALKSII